MTNSDPVFGFLERHGLQPSDHSAPFTGGEARIIPPGARNDTLTAIAGMLAKMRLAPNLIASALRGIATDPNSVGDTDYEADEIDRILEHIAGRASTPFAIDSYTVTTVTPNDPVRDLVWLIPDFLPAEGLTLLYGLPAQGKSWIALLCSLVAKGAVEWVDGYRIKRSLRVGYFDWERRGQMFKRRLKRICKGYGVATTEIDYVECRKPLGEMLDEVRELILARGYDFVVIDSLSIAIQTADLMAAHEIIPRMFALHEMGVPILMLDHQKKMQTGDSAQGGTAFGSMFKEAVASMIWQAVKVDLRSFTPGHMDFRLMHKKNNFDKAPEDIDLRLTMDDEAGTVRIDLLEETPRVSRVLEAMSHRDSMTLKEIAAVVGGISEDTIRRDLEAPDIGLIAQGAVKIVDPGGSGRGNSRRYALDYWTSSDHPTEPERK